MDAKTALLIILDCVDYTTGMCRANEMVGAVLPREVLELAKKAALEDGKDVPISAPDKDLKW